MANTTNIKWLDRKVVDLDGTYTARITKVGTRGYKIQGIPLQVPAAQLVMIDRRIHLHDEQGNHFGKKAAKKPSGKTSTKADKPSAKRRDTKSVKTDTKVTLSVPELRTALGKAEIDVRGMRKPELLEAYAKLIKKRSSKSKDTKRSKPKKKEPEMAAKKNSAKKTTTSKAKSPKKAVATKKKSGKFSSDREATQKLSEEIRAALQKVLTKPEYAGMDLKAFQAQYTDDLLRVVGDISPEDVIASLVALTDQSEKSIKKLVKGLEKLEGKLPAGIVANALVVDAEDAQFTVIGYDADKKKLRLWDGEEEVVTAIKLSLAVNLELVTDAVTDEDDLSADAYASMGVKELRAACKEADITCRGKSKPDMIELLQAQASDKSDKSDPSEDASDNGEEERRAELKGTGVPALRKEAKAKDIETKGLSKGDLVDAIIANEFGDGSDFSDTSGDASDESGDESDTSGDASDESGDESDESADREAELKAMKPRALAKAAKEAGVKPKANAKPATIIKAILKAEAEATDASDESGDESDASGDSSDSSDESGDSSDESGDSSDDSDDESGDESGDDSDDESGDESGDESDASGDESDESGDESDESGDESGDESDESGDESDESDMSSDD